MTTGPFFSIQKQNVRTIFEMIGVQKQREETNARECDSVRQDNQM
jgi:hypothetical protein